MCGRCASGSTGASRRSPNGARSTDMHLGEQKKTRNAKLPGLRTTDEHPEPSAVLSGCRTDLEEVAQSSYPREPADVGEIYRNSFVGILCCRLRFDIPGRARRVLLATRCGKSALWGP